MLLLAGQLFAQVTLVLRNVVSTTDAITSTGDDTNKIVNGGEHQSEIKVVLPRLTQKLLRKVDNLRDVLFSGKQQVSGFDGRRLGHGG